MSHSNQIDAWNQRLQLYARLGHDRLAAVAAVVQQARPLQAPILDIGTGKGMVAEGLAAAGGQVVSLDVDQAQSALARERIVGASGQRVAERIEFVVGDAASMPFGDGQFPLAVCVNAVHHLSSFEQVAKEIGRVLIPEGRIVLVDFTDEGFRILDEAFAQEGKKHVTSGLLLDDAIADLKRQGFAVFRDVEAHQQRLVTLRRG